MIGDACVFALTQISNDFGCEYGNLVTRRAGPDIACQSETMQQQCLCVYEQLKCVGLDAFELEDDLMQVPHGVWVKIQFGGLLGLQKQLDPSQQRQGDANNKIDNIASLIKVTQMQYENLEKFPYQTVVSTMQEYKTRRRRK